MLENGCTVLNHPVEDGQGRAHSVAHQSGAADSIGVNLKGNGNACGHKIPDRLSTLEITATGAVTESFAFKLLIISRVPSFRAAVIFT